MDRYTVELDLIDGEVQIIDTSTQRVIATKDLPGFWYGDTETDVLNDHTNRLVIDAMQAAATELNSE